MATITSPTQARVTGRTIAVLVTTGVFALGVVDDALTGAVLCFVALVPLARVTVLRRL